MYNPFTSALNLYNNEEIDCLWYSTFTISEQTTDIDTMHNNLKAESLLYNRIYNNGFYDFGSNENIATDCYLFGKLLRYVKSHNIRDLWKDRFRIFIQLKS